MMYLVMLVSYFGLILGILVCVAFIVLMERSVLGYIQLRKGPNKVGVLGILQSFSDAIKLFTSEQVIPSFSNIMLFYAAPLVSFSIILLLWMLMSINCNVVNMELGGLVLFCCTSFGVYSLMGSGWASNSNYAMLGAVRAIAQTISYEVSLAFLFLGLMVLSFALNIFLVGENQEYVWFMMFMLPFFLMWFTSSLAETNRTPFDFAEGKSELVSGFNVEYGSGGFAVLFLAEYASIIFMSYLMAVLFLGGLKNMLTFNILGMIICFMFVWMRGTFPRFRYDKLMMLAWKSFLPASLSVFCLMYIVSL